MQFSSAASFLWVLYFCLVLVRSAAGGSRDLLGRSVSARTVALPLALTLAVAAVPCTVLAAKGQYGDAALWCWVEDAGSAVRLYYLPLLCIWAVAVGSLGYVGWAVRRRVQLVLLEERTRKRNLALEASALGPDKSASAAIAGRALRQLVGFVAVFVFFSTFGLANRLYGALSGGAETPAALLVLQAWTMPLQGLANAAVFSRWLRKNWRLRGNHALPPEVAGGVTGTQLELTSSTAAAAAAAVAAAPVAAAAGSSSDAPAPTALLFAATWNVGEAPPPGVAALAAWLPPGRDAYFVGLQECLHPAAWQRALAAALAAHGGGEGYELLAERKIGSTQTRLGYHGFIALFAFARRRLRESGALHAVASGGAAVRRGTHLGARRASNKGAVGAAFRFHGQTIAVVSAHLAADKKGRVHLERRLRDVCSVLHGLELEYDECGAALQLACHHVLLLGDLNFRCGLPPAEALAALAAGSLAPLLRSDELRAAMRGGRVLHGFAEAEIGFLPSFRRVAGEAGKLSDAELAAEQRGELLVRPALPGTPPALRVGGLALPRLRQLYSVAAADGSARPPSYTDRVLRHSLTPALGAALSCTRYSCCEALAISDHRPVGAELRLRRAGAEEAGGLGTCEVLLRGLSLAGATATGGAGGGGGGGSGGGPEGTLGTPLPSAAPAAAAAAAAAGQAPAPAAALFAPVCASQVASIELLLPLPAERAEFALERLQSLFGGGDAGNASHAHTRRPWAEAARQGLRGSAQLRSAVTHHALLRLLDEGSGVLGEGVLAVAEAGASSGEASTCGATAGPVEVDLTVSGCLVGVLRGEAVVRWTMV